MCFLPHFLIIIIKFLLPPLVLITSSISVPITCDNPPVYEVRAIRSVCRACPAPDYPRTYEGRVCYPERQAYSLRTEDCQSWEASALSNIYDLKHQTFPHQRNICPKTRLSLKSDSNRNLSTTITIRTTCFKNQNFNFKNN